ncbi:response regulator [Romeria aff. gracilis LEGE 07310]|uniref:Response regulator n=1 Tax=Vasconcelosia minhoensis LEGE 07310 TaxID=915328 RepID=A0A8J7DMK1_9CYAN|nr:response regulator [Romeria gracilis]MBE9078951.1 response regulator [Romeria aff. gracilis LEGE 07310]
MKILLIEDDESVAKVLEKGLADEYYAVDVAHDGQTGWQLVSAFDYDMVILDVMLPQLSGLDLCRRLREQSYSMPVLLVTALDSSHKKIAGLNAGADDYITKPFELEELLTRVRVLMRRVQTPVSSALELGELCLDLSSREVTYGGTYLNLTPKEYGMLELFLRNPSQVFSRSAILDKLWSFSEAPGEDTVTSHIKGLRRKLSAAGAPADLVKTVYGVGYRIKSEPPVMHTQTHARRDRDPSPALASIANPRSTELREQQTHAALQTLWQSVKFQHFDRLELLKQAVRDLQAQQLSDQTRQSAYRAAHSLTGALGIFGLASGSKLAHQIEQILRGNAPLTADRERLIDLVEALDQVLNQALHQLEPPPLQLADLPLLVFVDDRSALPTEMVGVLKAAGLTVKVSPHAAALRDLMTALAQLPDAKIPTSFAVNGDLPDVVLVDFSLEASDPSDLAELSVLIDQVPSLMVLVCSADGSLAARVKAAHLGQHPFFHNLSAKQVFKTIQLLRSRFQQIPHKVLVVDDDPEVLAALRTLLEPRGFQIVTLNQPLDFWQTLKDSAPDLLLLDITMPKFSGIELCQAVRQAPVWSHLPIVFLTAHADTQVQQAAYRAGANDLVEKSLSSSELLARLFDQLRRTQLRRAMDAIAEGCPQVEAGG